MSPRLYTTEQAAKAVKITRATLQAWIKAGKVIPPAPTLDGARAKRLWSESDVSRLRKVKAKIYWQGRGKRTDRQRNDER